MLPHRRSCSLYAVIASHDGEYLAGPFAHRCHKREVFLQLEDGSYTTTSTEVCLRKELEGMLGPRAEVIANDVVSVDRTVMRLLVQEVADNAIKYSPPGSAFQAKATLKDGEKALLAIELAPT
eukprot:scaffold212094_cov40-Tisochrysis_lutea.AAC.5